MEKGNILDSIEIYRYGSSKADLVLVQPVDRGFLSAMEKEVTEIEKLTEGKVDFQVLGCVVESWNKQLSPWAAPPVFGKEAFGDGAAKLLEEICSFCEGENKTYVIGGYSLAGLFALWAAYQTERFKAVAAASASMWFPGFVEFMEEHDIRARRVYLSLGEDEERARNKVLASVGQRTREAATLLKERGVSCLLEWNKGNHFQDAELRMAKAFAWAIRALTWPEDV